MSVFRFRDFEFNTFERRLTRNGEWVDLTPKAMDILEVFVARPGVLITRDEIIGKVWGNTLVEEGNLSVHISKLRKALAESRDQRFIQTMAGAGYRFTATIEHSGNGHLLQRTSPELIETPNGNGFHGRDSEAIRLLTKAKYFFEDINPTTIHKAIECLERSLTFDPANPETNAFLVYGYRLLHSFGFISVAEALRKMEIPVAQMLDLGRLTSFACVTAGEVEMFLKADLEFAERYFHKALELEPESALAHYRLCEVFAFSKRAEEALKRIPILSDLQSYSPAGYTRIARLFYFLRRHESAIVYLNEVLDLHPKHFPALLIFGAVMAELGQYEEAASSFSESYDLHPNPESLAMLGYIYALQGKRDLVKDIVTRVSNSYPTYGSVNSDLARILLANKDDRGYEFLEMAIDKREVDLISISVDPRWARVRSEERFRNIERTYFFPRKNQKAASRFLEKAA